MNSKINKYLTRLESLIQQLEELQHTPKKIYSTQKVRAVGFDHLDISDEVDKKLQLDIKTILTSIFGKNNRFLKEFEKILGDRNLKNYRIESTLGILKSALENIELGYIEGIEFQITNKIFDSLLEEIKNYIFTKQNKDIGALLLRIVLEYNLKRIAKKNNIEIKNEKGKDKKISQLNDNLKEANIYNQTQWRQIQAWLDIGNDAHQGKFNGYDLSQVKDFYNGLEGFIARYF